MRFGVHVGIGGGLRKAVDEAVAAGCDCIQIFAGNPRGWRTTPYDASSWQEFARLRAERGIWPTVIHTSYLINLASSNRSLQSKSAKLVAHDLDVAARGGIEYVNTHLGSYGAQDRHKGFERACDTIRRLTADAAPGPMLLLENSAGAGNLCGGTLEELGALLDRIDSPGIGVCIDTAHAWASGYDISDAAGVRAFLKELGRRIGFKRLRVLHLNDTEIALGGKRDRHWHVGRGLIGDAGFRALLRSPQLAHVAVICETPKTPELDRANVRAARRLAGASRAKAK